jgi:hypothetical protein
MKHLLQLIIPLTALILLVGCASPPTDKDVYSKKVISGFFSASQDPRRYSLTVYQSKYGPVFSGATRLHENQFAQLEFSSPKRTRLPEIDILGRTRIPVPTLLDTTARDTWVNLTAATALGALPLGPPPFRRYPDHTTEADPGYAAFLSKLKIGDIHVENTIVYVRTPQITLGAMKRGADDPAPDAVIGCRLLRKFAFVRFDFPEEELIISSTKPYSGDPALLLADVPYKTENGSLAVDAWIDTKRTTLLIDTAGDFEVAWNQAQTNTISKLFIGDLCLQDVEVIDSMSLPLAQPELPRIGLRLLRRFALIMDNKRRHLLIEKPTSRSRKSKSPVTTKDGVRIHDEIITY